MTLDIGFVLDDMTVTETRMTLFGLDEEMYHIFLEEINLALRHYCKFSKQLFINILAVCNNISNNTKCNV